ncbi:MAG: A/G-specific adenine glycosylase [Bacteroidaceae bacterium]|nr:A/G-specific adenine glycosylase [Bacteroidaceae bacterium]
MIKEKLEAWYALHHRQLPWRNEPSAYRVWLSEIILQQTRVEQGRSYYERFVTRFPNVEILAAASQDEVMQLWQGLGYYSRARNLHAAAQQIVAAGRFPETYDEVRRLRGVGDYTAAAICSIAYNQPCAVVDGNVYRVLSRLFAIATPIDTTTGKRTFAKLAQEQLDKKRPGLYNQAIMDFGAMVCTPLSPHCGECPLAAQCMAHAAHEETKYPLKSRRTAVATRFFVYVYVRRNGHVLWHRRAGNDIWRGLYEPYLAEFPHQPSPGELIALPVVGQATMLRTVALQQKHVLTHRRLYADFYMADVPTDFKAPDGYVWTDEAELGNYAVPRLVELLLEKM